METKAKRLKKALETNEIPPMCTVKERWKNRKCLDYCAVAENCDFGRMIKSLDMAA